MIIVALCLIAFRVISVSPSLLLSLIIGPHDVAHRLLLISKLVVGLSFRLVSKNLVSLDDLLKLFRVCSSRTIGVVLLGQSIKLFLDILIFERIRFLGKAEYFVVIDRGIDGLI